MPAILSRKDGSIYIRANWLFGAGKVMTRNKYDHLVRNNEIRIIKAHRGNPAAVHFESLKPEHREAVEAQIGDVQSYFKSREYVEQFLESDPSVYAFYAKIEVNGRPLPSSKVVEYSENVMFLNAIGRLKQDVNAFRAATGGKKMNFWEEISRVYSVMRDEYSHKLPRNSRALKRRYELYKRDGKLALVSKKIGNQNSKKRNEEVERLIYALYTTEHNPFVKRVYELYKQFLKGEIEVIDKDTGEVFERENFKRNGSYVELSFTSVWNIITSPEMSMKLQRKRKSSSDYTLTESPFVHRKPPEYSLSKITMDDRTLPRKAGQDWVNVYYAMDVHSQCYLAAVYTYEKVNSETVRQCFQELYKFLTHNKLPWPGEVEVERHLMKQIEQKLRNSFAYVRICNPRNSREKRAEHLIRAKKYSDEKNHQVGIERWYGKGAFKKNEDIKIKISREQVVVEDQESIQRFNNSQHPTKRNKTRLQVLFEDVNENLQAPTHHIVAKEFGYKRATTIKNNDYFDLNYDQYWIDKETLSRLAPNNYSIDVYFIPNSEGDVKKAYVFQSDTYVGEAVLISKFQEAQVEQTEADKTIFLEQQKRIAKFNKKIKEQDIPRVVCNRIDATVYEGVESTETIESTETVEVPEASGLTEDISIFLTNPKRDAKKSL